jgi:hypothetical protein
LGYTHEEITDRDENNDGEGVEVRQNIVRHTVHTHGCSLRDQIIVDLVVRQPFRQNKCQLSTLLTENWRVHTVDGVPAEHCTSEEASLDFINPNIVKRHPLGGWTLLLARLRALPEVICLDVLPEPDRVPAPSALHGEAPDVQSRGEN